MREGHEIIDKVYAAKSDPDAADSLIRQYMGFIRSETAKFLHRPPEEGRDEEFSIAMLAFYESILGYEKGRGVFLSYAARGIRNRLIDHYRKEKRHANLSSLHEPVEDDAETLKIDRLEDSKNHIQDLHDRNAAREEIDEFVKKAVGVWPFFSDVADNCPRQSRTFAACQKSAGSCQNWNRSLLQGNDKQRKSFRDSAGSGIRSGEKDVRKTSEVSGGGAAGLYERI